MRGILISGVFELTEKSKTSIIFAIIHLFSKTGRTFHGSVYESDRARPFLSDDFIYDDRERVVRSDKVSLKLLEGNVQYLDMDERLKTYRRQGEAKIKDGLLPSIMKAIGRDFKAHDLKLVGREYHTLKGTVDFLLSDKATLFAVEVKVGDILIEDVRQLEGYVSEFLDKMPGKETIGILIGKNDYKKGGTYSFYSISDLEKIGNIL